MTGQSTAALPEWPLHALCGDQAAQELAAGLVEQGARHCASAVGMPAMPSSSGLLSRLNRSNGERTVMKFRAQAGRAIWSPPRPPGIHDDGPELIDSDGFDV